MTTPLVTALVTPLVPGKLYRFTGPMSGLWERLGPCAETRIRLAGVGECVCEFGAGTVFMVVEVCATYEDASACKCVCAGGIGFRFLDHDEVEAL